MPRFYFNFRHGDVIAKDDEGTELPGLEEAKAMALVSVRELLAESIKEASDTPVEAVIVTDESGKELVAITANEVLPESFK